MYHLTQYKSGRSYEYTHNSEYLWHFFVMLLSCWVTGSTKTFDLNTNLYKDELCKSYFNFVVSNILFIWFMIFSFYTKVKIDLGFPPCTRMHIIFLWHLTGIEIVCMCLQEIIFIIPISLAEWFWLNILGE